MRAPLPAATRPAAGDTDDDLVAVDLRIDDGRIDAIAPAGSFDAAECGPDLDASMVLPGMVDCTPTSTRATSGRASPTPPATGPVRRRSHRSRPHRQLACRRRAAAHGLRPRTAYAKGVVAIRTHLDSLAPQASISFPVFREMRERWAGRIDLQASSIAPLNIFLTDEGRQLADIVAESGGQAGLRHPSR